MTKQEIEQAAKKYSNYSSFKLVRYAYTSGAEMVNSRQPFTAEDIIAEIVKIKAMTEHLNQEERNQYFDELIKLWEESKNG